MIRAVMFDFGGVISSSPFEAFAHLEAEHGLPTDFIRTVNATNTTPTRGRSSSEARSTSRRSGRCGRPRPGPGARSGRAAGARTAGRRDPAADGRGHPCLRDGVQDRLPDQQLHPGEAVLSVEVAEVYALFDAVLESRVLGVRKPDPRFYELACETLGVQPDECVFLDDLGVNLKPARALGMHTIKVADPDAALAELGDLLGLALTT